jgi:SAM-dependent methyltransferase
MPQLRCPSCHTGLAGSSSGLTCPTCHRTYPVENDIADFSGGKYYDTFDASTRLSADAEKGLALEVDGARRRIINYYEPRLRERSAIRVLDCGTGNGIAVDLLNERGFEAWGADLSALRKHQWRERVRRDRLVVADIASLPFPDGYFDAVIASGVLEHIGVAEARIPHYTVKPLPSRDAERRSALEQLLRVTSPTGTVFVDFPNGAFPIDFWHGDTPGEARWHSLAEGFLPRFREVASLCRAIDPRLKVRAVSPHGRLQFVQAVAHWYGRLLSLPARLFFLTMRMKPMSWLARTALNPFLVIEIGR